MRGSGESWYQRTVLYVSTGLCLGPIGVVERVADDLDDSVGNNGADSLASSAIDGLADSTAGSVADSGDHLSGTAVWTLRPGPPCTGTAAGTRRRPCTCAAVH
eukprot:768793-Rhodomonas_salina.3